MKLTIDTEEKTLILLDEKINISELLNYLKTYSLDNFTIVNTPYPVYTPSTYTPTIYTPYRYEYRQDLTASPKNIPNTVTTTAKSVDPYEVRSGYLSVENPNK